MSRRSFTIRRRAARDLSRQAAWFAREAGADVAKRFLIAAQESFGDLAGTPGLGAPVQRERPRTGEVRKWRIRGFPDLRIFYAERPGGGVAVIRVLHAAQDWMRELDMP